MDVMLMVVTIVSLGVAALMSVVAWRQVQESRARSEARVAALSTAMASSSSMDAPLVTADSMEPETRADGLFGTAAADQEPAARRLAPALGIGALIVGTIIVLAIAASGGSRGGGEGRSGAVATPLELLSLRDSQQAGTLTVSGLVRNPAGAPAIDRITAVVFFFDSGGAFLTSARAPLDFPRVGPGEESPFEVRVPTPSGVSRYRVSFRRADGPVVAHVDRRGRI